MKLPLIPLWFLKKKVIQWFLRLFGLIDRFAWCNSVYLTPTDYYLVDTEVWLKLVEEQKAAMLTEAKRLLPKRAWDRIKIIYKPPCTCGTGFLDDPLCWRGCVIWKYTPEKL